MKYALDSLNTAIILLLEVESSVLNLGGQPVSVYTEIATNSSFPLITIASSTASEARVTSHSIGQSQIVNVEVIDKYKVGAGGFGENNYITNQICQLIRRKGFYLDLSAGGFKVINQSIQLIQSLREDYVEGIYFRTIISIEFQIEELV
jgi:hypothetical protein